MSKNEFSMCELYDCLIKATQPLTINGREIELGEVIAYFDSIQISNFQEITKKIAATGGWDNRAWVIWETIKEEDLIFTQGIFSKQQLALMTNSKMYQVKPETLELHKREFLESDEEGYVILSQIPKYDLFIYNQNGKKLKWQQDETDFKKFKIIDEENTFQDLIIDYYYMYENGSSYLKIGDQFLSSYVQLEAKTKIKDDITGRVRTGIIRIPKLKILSDFTIRLGKQANPYVSTLKAVALPVGERHNSYVCSITFLDDDIDSDF